MKKILIFSLAYLPRFTSGAEAAIKEITERISPDDIEFHMITLWFGEPDTREEKIDNVMVHRVGFDGAYISKIFFVPLAAMKGVRLHNKYQFDALWAMMTYMLFPVSCMRLMGVKVPHVLTLQDGDPYEKVFERWFVYPLTPLLDFGFKTASIIQVISEYLGAWPTKRGYKGEIVLIHNGANPQSINPTHKEGEIEELKKSLGKKEGDIFLTNTARLVYQKGFDTTIRALPLLDDHIKLLVVGGGTEDQNLKDLVKELKLENRVIFTGPVERSEVSKYRFASDIFVGPSRSEGLGNAFLSAMACRLPVIATQEGGIAEFLFDKERNPDKETTGFAVDKENSEQIAEKVKYILSHKEEVNQVVITARKMVEEKYDWDNVARDMRKKIFSKVLKRYGN